MGEEARKYAVTHLNRDEILHKFELSMLKACGFSSLHSLARSSMTQKGEPGVEGTPVTLKNIGDD
jgi:hypothetical protein